MASEYWKWKFRDVQPDVKRELTPEEKRKNWWHYYKWHVGVGILLFAIAVNLVLHALGFGEVKPDYRFAFVGKNALPDDTIEALQNSFAEMGEDLNGDGKVVVEVRQFASYVDVDASAAVSAEVRLMADLVEGESYFFLLENPKEFQLGYRSLCLLDGSLPETGDFSAEGTYFMWKDCPVLMNLDLGGFSYLTVSGEVSGESQNVMSKLAVARRGFQSGDEPKHQEGFDALWAIFTEGAVS